MNENQISIPTQYGRTIFKSTLEARWAVFFDQLKLKWKYEPKQYGFGHGYAYKPTFLIQGIGRVEVRLNFDELQKVQSRYFLFKKKICADGSDYFIFCASKAGDQVKSSIIEIVNGSKIIEGFEFAYCNSCDRYILEIQDNEFFNSRHCDHKRHSSIICKEKSLIDAAFGIANNVKIIDQGNNKPQIIISP